MKVKCVLCDTVESLADDSWQAKQLRNRRTRMYLCQSCHERIAKNTYKRHATGKFQLFRTKKNKELI
ncbi:MAG TPA: YlaI family protein [Bacillota bacterium]|nr:YlaI family protein [Bacillota bacterium]